MTDAVYPVPPGRQINLTAHHWLERFTADGKSDGPMVLLWVATHEHWVRPGDPLTQPYNATHFRYVAPCPLPVEW